MSTPMQGLRLPVAFGKVQPVADDELVENLEAHEIEPVRLRDGPFSRATRRCLRWQTGLFDDLDDHRKGLAGVEDIVDEQHVAIADVECQAVQDLRLANGFRFVT